MMSMTSITYTEKNPLPLNLREPIILLDCPASLDMGFIACMLMGIQKTRDSFAGGLVLHDGPQAIILHAVQRMIVRASKQHLQPPHLARNDKPVAPASTLLLTMQDTGNSVVKCSSRQAKTYAQHALKQLFCMQFNA